MQNVVSVKNLSKTYSNQFQALNNINLDIKQNEIFALLGPNGAGKTTFYNALTGFENISILDIAEMVVSKIPAEIVVTESNDPRSYRQDSTKLLNSSISRVCTPSIFTSSIEKMFSVFFKRTVNNSFNTEESPDVGLFFKTIPIFLNMQAIILC